MATPTKGNISMAQEKGTAGSKWANGDTYEGQFVETNLDQNIDTKLRCQ